MRKHDLDRLLAVFLLLRNVFVLAAKQAEVRVSRDTLTFRKSLIHIAFSGRVRVVRRVRVILKVYTGVRVFLLRVYSLIHYYYSYKYYY